MENLKEVKNQYENWLNRSMTDDEFLRIRANILNFYETLIEIDEERGKDESNN